MERGRERGHQAALKEASVVSSRDDRERERASHRKEGRKEGKGAQPEYYGVLREGIVTRVVSLASVTVLLRQPGISPPVHFPPTPEYGVQYCRMSPSANNTVTDSNVTRSGPVPPLGKRLKRGLSGSIESPQKAPESRRIFSSEGHGTCWLVNRCKLCLLE